MKPKTLILMGVAILCGLTAAFVTSRFISEREETVTILFARKACGPLTRIENTQDLFETKELLPRETLKYWLSNPADLQGRTVLWALLEGEALHEENLLSPDEEYLLGPLDSQGATKGDLSNMLTRLREMRSEHSGLRRTTVVVLILVLFFLLLLAELPLTTRGRGFRILLLWKIRVLSAQPTKPEWQQLSSAAPMSWYRVFLGVGFALLGVVNFQHAVDFLNALSADSFADPGTTAAGIICGSVFLGGVIAGATTGNGPRQGACVGIGASLALVPFFMTSRPAPWTFTAVYLLVLAICIWATLGGLFGSLLILPAPQEASGLTVPPAEGDSSQPGQAGA